MTDEQGAPRGPVDFEAYSVAWGLPMKAALLAGWLGAVRVGLEAFLPASGPVDERNRWIGFLTMGAALLLALAGTILLRRRGDLRGLMIGTLLRVGLPLATAAALALDDETQARAAFGWMTAYFLLGAPLEVWLSLPPPHAGRTPRFPPGNDASG